MIRGAVFTLCAGRQARERFSAWSSRVHETVPRLNWPAMRTYGRDDTCTGPVVELLYVGGLYHRKGIRWLLEAMQMLNRRGERRFHLRLAGDGADRVEYEALRDHLGLTDAITFLGHVRSGPDLFRLYQEADIFVFPSLGEGFPRVLYEAMASSLPVVATAVNSIPLVMPSGERALLVPPQDAAALGEAVLRLSQDGDLRRCLIASGRSFMERIMSRSDGGQQFAELLSQYATATT